MKLLARHADEISYVGLTENVSEGGAFVATRAPWDIGSAFDLIMALPQQKIVHARARVRWHRSESRESSTAPGIGIRFERLTAEELDRIREFMAAE